MKIQENECKPKGTLIPLIESEVDLKGLNLRTEL